MKNKRIMYALISILFLTIFFGITKVNAEEYKGQAIWPSEKIANIYIRKYREDGYIKYQQGAFIRRSEDNKFVYCLQPYVDIDNNLPYYKIARSDFAVYLNMTEEQWQRISLLAYYGYQYKENGYDHSAKKWYVITQVMIWRTAVPTSRIVFTDTLNGKDLPNKFASEIAEMEDLLNKHYTKPNFNLDGVKLPIGKSMDFTDTNGILNQFTISSVENGVASINGNTLTITSNSTENVKVKLIKKLSYWSSTPIVYYSNHSQNVMRVGNVDPIPKSIELESVGGKVEINKVDSETKNNIPQGNATLGGAKYGIYNLNNEKVGEITTDENGYAKTSLPYGKYTISQENNTPNYEKVENFEIEVNENTGNNIYKLLSNAPIEAKLKVIKTDKETGEVITKAGIKFKIKDANTSEYICQTITYPTAKKVCEYETDENGVIITPANLVGDFLLEEVKNQVLDGYVWNSEAMPIHIGEGSEILVDKDYGALLVVKFANERVKGKLNITKYGEKLIIDNNTFGYEKILLSEVELELYANEDIYIGSKKKYSKDELITTVTTNNGKAVIDNLELGKYYIKEKSTDNNHVLDEKIYTFELKYKDQYTKEIVKDVELQNYYKKGTLEFTKTDLVSGKPIPNTLIEIYSDKELEDGTIESTLIFSGLTDENGQITIKDLFIGKGHIIEKESATGYQITEEIVEFEIKENGEIVKANLTNEQIVEVPNTMANESKLYTVISITCMVVGMGVFLYVSKKNKKK